MDIQEQLFRLQDLKYRDFQAPLIPNVPKELMIGVRTPDLRKLAKELTKSGEGEAFLLALPHEYYEEDNLHAFLLGEIRDFARCVQELDRFLPYVDNWASCDSLRPRVLAKHKEALLPHVRRWIASEHCYTRRFGLEMLMCHFLDEAFRPEYLELAVIDSGEYYVNMMVAWFFATALAKQYEATLPYLEERRLQPWTHNKAIQKAVESFRVHKEQKETLKTLKIKG